jgi:hypothetical protein
VKLSDMDVSDRGNRYRATIRVSDCARPGVAWFDVPAHCYDWLNLENYDGFVVALYLQAMHEGNHLAVDGLVSSSVLCNLRYYGHIYAGWFPELNTIDVSVREALQAPRPYGAGCVTGLSCGVDSLMTARQWAKTEKSTSDRLTHFVNMNVGAHGEGPAGRELFRSRLKRVRKAAREIGLPVIDIHSNLSEFYTIPFERTYAARMAGLIHLLNRFVGHYVIASTNTYWQLGPEGSSPLSDFLLGSDHMHVIHDGAQYSRIDKMRCLSDWPIAHRYLNVCTRNTTDASNCSRCDKCARAMLTLRMLGTWQRFEAVFDFSDYDQVCSNYVSKMRKRGAAPPNYYWMEIEKHAAEIRYALH